MQVSVCCCCFASQTDFVCHYHSYTPLLLLHRAGRQRSITLKSSTQQWCFKQRGAAAYSERS